MRVGVTGATGFIGSALMPALAARGHDAVALPRTDFEPMLPGIDAVIHVAGLAHRTGGNAPSTAEFQAANAKLPLRVHAAARAAGVRHMIHISTIAVLSGHTGVLRENLPLAPTTPYDRAKAEAETALLAEAGGPALTIVRPPLVYGPGAKANLRTLMRFCDSPLPLPFAAVNNRRSMVGLGNLVDALLFLLAHPTPGIVHVSDGNDLSFAKLVGTIRSGLGRAPNLFSCPPALIAAGLGAIGRGWMAQLVLGDQQVEMAAIREHGWTPPNAPEVDLFAMAAAYAAQR